MSLFQECQEVLSEDFEIIDNTDFILDILNNFPIQFNNIDWKKIHYKDYDDMGLLFKELNVDESIKVFIFVDDNDVPIFQSNLKLVVNNIYDVMALASKVFIFNDNIILYPLFPTYTIRVGKLP